MPSTRWIIACLVLVHGVLNSAVLFPDLYGLGVDESEFIQNARLTANAWRSGVWVLPEYAYNPLGTLLYLALYVPVAASSDWFMLVLWASRLLLFLSLWGSVLLIAHQVRSLAPPLVVAALMFVVPVHQGLTSSEGLFAVFAGLAFWQVLKYVDTRQLRNLVLAGALVGLAGLTRNDGAVLLLLASGLVVLAGLVRRDESGDRLRKASRAIVALLVPGMLVMGGYLLAQGTLAGEFDPGLAHRSYLAFEQGEGVAFSGQPNAWFAGIWEARALYGTPEENGFSVPRAIARNPRAFVKRAGQSAMQLPILAVVTYGGGTGVLLMVLAAAGAAWLVRRGHLVHALLLVGWPLHLLVYLAFFYRSGYLFMPYFTLVLLAAIGAWQAGPALALGWGRWLAGASAVAGGGLGVLTGVAALVTNGVVIAAGLLLFRRLAPWSRTIALERIAFVAVVLAVMLLIRVPYPARLPQLGATGGEQAAAFLAHTFQRNTVVAAFTREEVWMARLVYASPTIDLASPGSAPLELRTAQDVREWVRRSGVQAIYLSDIFRWLGPDLYRLIESEIGRDYREVFSVIVMPPELKRRLVDFDPNFTPDGRHRVLVPTY